MRIRFKLKESKRYTCKDTDRSNDMSGSLLLPIDLGPIGRQEAPVLLMLHLNTVLPSSLTRLLRTESLQSHILLRKPLIVLHNLERVVVKDFIIPYTILASVSALRRRTNISWIRNADQTMTKNA